MSSDGLRIPEHGTAEVGRRVTHERDLASVDERLQLVPAGHELGRIPGVPRPTLAFKDGRMSAFSGCNSASAAARLVDDWLEVQEMASTRRGCPEPLGSFETRYFKLLGARPVFLVDGDTLTLVAGSQNARLRRAGASDGQDRR